MKKGEEDDLRRNLNDFESGTNFEETKTRKKMIAAVVIILVLFILELIVFYVFFPINDESTIKRLSIRFKCDCLYKW